MNGLAPATSERTITVVLVDDHAVVRQGLRAILEREDDLSVVGEASDAHEARAGAGRANPDSIHAASAALSPRPSAAPVSRPARSAAEV